MKAAAALVAFVVLLVALAAFAPATFADRRLAALTAGKFRIADASGTLWHGSGVLTDGAGTWRIPLRWRIAPDSIARGTLAVTLLPTDGAALPRGSIEAANGTLMLRHVAAEIPARSLLTALPAGDAITVGGIIAFDAPAYTWNAERSGGAIDARWRGARLFTGAVTLDLGTVAMTLTPQNQRLEGRIDNIGGDVRIDGTLTVTAAAMSADVVVVPLASAPQHVMRALASLGTPDGSGAVRLAWRSGAR